MRTWLLLCCLFHINSLLGQPDSLADNIYKTKKFRKGVFRNYSEFKANKPSITENFTIEPEPKFDVIFPDSALRLGYVLPNQVSVNKILHLGAVLRDKKGHKVRDVYGFSDGESLYINSSMYQSHSSMYWRVLEAGEIIYFRDPRMNMLQGVTMGWAVAGVLGSAVGASAADSQPDGVMIFSQDEGYPYEADKGSLESLLREYDAELLKQYAAEPKMRSNATIERYIILYNRKHVKDP